MISKRRLLLVIIAILVISIGVAGSVIAGQKNVLPADIADKIQNSVDNLVSEIKPGMIIHVQHEVYNRYGDAKTKIIELDWTVPEETVRDIWIGPVDKDGFFVGFKSQVKDVNANIVQETIASGTEKVHYDIRTGKEMKSEWEPMSAAKFLDFTGNMPSKLLDKGWSFSSKGQWDGKETVIFEKTTAFVPHTDVDGSIFTNIPYTMDLKPASILLRLEVRLDNPLLQISQMWAIDAQGEKTLLSQDRWMQVDMSN
jgi:hypothetical protein